MYKHGCHLESYTWKIVHQIGLIYWSRGFNFQIHSRLLWKKFFKNNLSFLWQPVAFSRKNEVSFYIFIRCVLQNEVLMNYCTISSYTCLYSVSITICVPLCEMSLILICIVCSQPANRSFDVLPSECSLFANELTTTSL